MNLRRNVGEVRWLRSQKQRKQSRFLGFRRGGSLIRPCGSKIRAYVSRGDSYGVPDGAPATCQEKARNEDAVRSIAGSTVE